MRDVAIGVVAVGLILVATPAVAAAEQRTPPEATQHATAGGFGGRW